MIYWCYNATCSPTMTASDLFIASQVSVPARLDTSLSERWEKCQPGQVNKVYFSFSPLQFTVIAVTAAGTHLDNYRLQTLKWLSGGGTHGWNCWKARRVSHTTINWQNCLTHQAKKLLLKKKKLYCVNKLTVQKEDKTAFILEKKKSARCRGASVSKECVEFPFEHLDLPCMRHTLTRTHTNQMFCSIASCQGHQTCTPTAA